MKLFYIFLILTLCLGLRAQQHEDTLKLKLKEYLIEHEMILQEFSVEEVNEYFFLVEMIKVDSVFDSVGIYKFGVMASHANSYLLLVDTTGSKILDFKDLEVDLITLCKFLELNNKKFRMEQKILYLRKTLNMIESNNASRYF